MKHVFKYSLITAGVLFTLAVLWWFQLPPVGNLALGICPPGWSHETGFTGSDFYAMKCEKNSDDYGKQCSSSNDCSHQCSPNIGLDQIRKECEVDDERGGYRCESVAGTCTAISRYTTEIVEPGLVLPAFIF